VRFRWLRALLVFVVATGALIPALAWFACVVAPPRTSDGHPVMPMGQAAFGILFGPVLGLVAGYLAGRRRRAAE
jgi:O-antigen/teichoic acid export membrane protein